jgi:NTE family protein
VRGGGGGGPLEGVRSRIALACQGGGSHTAFTAGVLQGLLEARRDDLEIVALSGTSGGAICALLAWDGLLRGDPRRGVEQLERFWQDTTASSLLDAFLNYSIQLAIRLRSLVALPEVSPYAYPSWSQEQLRQMLERRVDFAAARALAGRDQACGLLVGAVDVLNGAFAVFRGPQLSADCLLASAALPELFPAVDLEGRWYWDGLFSQNPPVRELLDTRPDEIWVIQINPKETDAEPKTVVEIADRRNELSGNLSLYQELHFIEEMNRLQDEGLLRPGGRYGRVVVRIIELARSRTSRLWGPASKLDREPGFLRQLMDQGELQATEFLTALGFEDAWGRQDAHGVARYLCHDAEADSSAPFPERGPVRGRAEVHRFLEDHFASAVCMDLNRKQVVRDHVTWTAHGQVEQGGPAVEGRCEVTFVGPTVTRIRLGPTA